MWGREDGHQGKVLYKRRTNYSVEMATGKTFSVRPAHIEQFAPVNGESVSIGAGGVGDLSAILGLPKRITPQTHPELVDFEVKSGDVVLMWRGGPVDLVKVERVESDKIVNGKRYNWRKSRYVQKLDASRYVRKLDASRYVQKLDASRYV